MIGRFTLPALAIVGAMVAVWVVLYSNQPAPTAPPVTEPARAPFASYLAGGGIVEASTENIEVGTPVSGIVTAIYVRWDDHVNAGDALFKIDDRDLQAQLLPYIARVKEAKANLAKARSELRLVQSVPDRRAISVEELVSRRSTVAVDEAGVELANAQVEDIRMEIERRTVRALVSGRVLQIKTRLGEFALAGVLSTPLMLLGRDSPKLHVRVDIDQNDAWRFKSGAQAVGYVRGNSRLKTPLQFVRVEPYVMPKVSLTGQSTERVDTRVLQVIYSFDPAALPVFVGQQMDVYIQAEPPDLAQMRLKHEASP